MSAILSSLMNCFSRKSCGPRWRKALVYRISANVERMIGSEMHHFTTSNEVTDSDKHLQRKKVLRKVDEKLSKERIRPLPLKPPKPPILSSLKDQEKALEEGVTTHSSTLAWKIPWIEEPDGLQVMGSQKSQTQLNTHNNTQNTQQKLGSLLTKKKIKK